MRTFRSGSAARRIEAPRIICGRSEEVLAELKAESIDLVVTSPPYDDLRTYNGFRLDFDAIADGLARILKPGGAIVWIVADQTIEGSETGTSFRQALGFMQRGLRLHDTMIYRKRAVSFPTPGRYFSTFEFMFILTKGRPRAINLLRDRPNVTAGAKVKGRQRERDGSLRPKHGATAGKVTASHGIRFNVWDYHVGGRCQAPDPYWREHPATFPLALARDHVRSWSDPGDVVLDCFNGSGTSGVAAFLEGRRYVGIDTSAEYCELTERRLAWYAERADELRRPAEELAAAA